MFSLWIFWYLEEGGWWGRTIKPPRLPSFWCIFFCPMLRTRLVTNCVLTPPPHPPTHPVLAPAHLLCCDVPAGAVNTRPLFLCSVFPVAETNHLGAERWTLWPNGPLHLSVFSSRGRHPFDRLLEWCPPGCSALCSPCFPDYRVWTQYALCQPEMMVKAFWLVWLCILFLFFSGGGARRLRHLPRVCAVTVYFDPWFRRRHC